MAMDETATQQAVVSEDDENPVNNNNDKDAHDDKKKKKSRCCCVTTTCVVLLLLLATSAALVWYFIFFVEDSPDPVASCGDCHCIVDGDGEGGKDATCPTNVPRIDYTIDEINVWASQIALNAYELECNPYTDENCDTTPPLDDVGVYDDDAVCAMHIETVEEEETIDNNTTTASPKSCKFAPYKLKTYPSWEDATAAGGFVTHVGACGVCSTMKDLAAYVKSTDLTTQGEFCAKQGAFSFDVGRECYMDLGMTESCARLWSFNAWNTATDCIGSCVLNGGFTDLPNNGPAPECALNECLQCDEDKSGPIFKQFGGRTRRRSGLLSAIARPCSQVVSRLEQDACPVTMPLREEDEDET